MPGSKKKKKDAVTMVKQKQPRLPNKHRRRLLLLFVPALG